MAQIIWLASYPKSGNTWFRSFISNLLADRDEPVNINSMLTDGIASNRAMFDEWVGIEASDLTFEEIDQMRPELYQAVIDNSPRDLYIKTHDAYTYLPDGRPLIPNYKAKAIYIIRNPLDVAVSFSFHANDSFDNTIAKMADEENSFCSGGARLHNQLRQQLLSWSSHVKSWLDNSSLPVEVIRYEDMMNNPQATFKRAARFAGIDCDDGKIKKAIAFSDFKILKQQEEKDPFKERPSKMKGFFRAGKSGGWNDYLNAGQVKRIVDDHFQVMHRFGYLNEEGKIVNG